jgi:hypothetical protein
MYKFLIIFLFSISTSIAQTIPKEAIGAINPNVTQENISQNICVPNWTSTVRPTASATNKIKYKQLELYGIPKSDDKLFELDHKIPLSSGGALLDNNNLWLQSWNSCPSAKNKDRLEVKIKKLICSKKITLKEGREAMVDWVASYNKRIGKLVCK